MPKPTDDGKTYTFKIRHGREVPRRQPSSRRTDVAASWQQHRLPAAGRRPARASATTPWSTRSRRPTTTTVVFRLKFATTAFLPALADPFTWIYKKEILDKDPHWYEKNIMGSGPFKFASYEVGQSIKGVRNPDYYHKGQPYLDGIDGIFADKQSVRVDAIRADRAAIEFRGLPPSARDQLVKEARRQDVAVQDSDWNCGNIITPNHKKKPFDDVRVRRALALAIDQWDGAPALSKIANVQHGGRHRLPGLAAGRDQGGAAADRRLLARHREVARRGAAAAEGGRRRGAEVRADQPQRRPALQVRRHLADRRVEARSALNVEQKVVPTGPWFAGDARRQFRRRGRGQLPERRQSGARHRQVPAEVGLSRELRRLRRSEVDRALQQDAARDRSGEAARRHARLREAHARHRGARASSRRTGTASSPTGPT